MKTHLAAASLLCAATFLMLTGCASSAKQYASPDEWVAESKQGQRLPLGNKAGEWSAGKTFAVGKALVEVKSEFVKHHGSTCHFNVKYTNVGQTAVDATSGLTTQERVNIYGHNSGKVRLEPGKSTTYNDLEARECPIIFGTSTEMNGCAACQSWVVFAQ